MMKTQKEAVALRLQIDELRKMQEATKNKSRRAEMEREGIPSSGVRTVLKFTFFNIL